MLKLHGARSQCSCTPLNVQQGAVTTHQPELITLPRHRHNVLPIKQVYDKVNYHHSLTYVFIEFMSGLSTYRRNAFPHTPMTLMSVFLLEKIHTQDRFLWNEDTHGHDFGIVSSSSDTQLRSSLVEETAWIDLTIHTSFFCQVKCSSPKDTKAGIVHQLELEPTEKRDMPLYTMGLHVILSG